MKDLTDAGFVSQGGTNHEHFTKGNVFVQVPRHREIPDQTAKRILRQAGLRYLRPPLSIRQRTGV